MFERRELRLELRLDGKAAPAQALDKPDDHTGSDDDDEAQQRRAQDIKKPALGVQRIDHVDAGNVEDREDMPDLAETAAHPRPTRGARRLSGDPCGDWRPVLQ